MRRPEVHRAISITLVLASVASVVAAIEFDDGRVDPDIIVGLGAGGLMVGIGAIIYAINAQLQTVRYRRLRRGEGVIARWIVNPQLWRLFNEHLRKKPADRPDGVEVIVGEDGAIVDGDYTHLSLRGASQVLEVRLIELSAPYLEYDLLAQTKNGTVRWQHHVPVGLGGLDDARRVIASYHARFAAIDRRSIAARNPGRLRTISIVIAVLAAIGGVIGFSMRGATDDIELPLTLAIVGVLVTPVAVIFAIIAHVMARRQIEQPAPPPPARSPRGGTQPDGPMPPPARRARDLSSRGDAR